MSGNIDLHYEFGSTDFGDETGFNDAVSKTFDTNVPSAVARESLQNSIDAGMGKKVTVKFSMRQINSKELPNPKELEKILYQCREYFRDHKECFEFYDNAYKILNQNKRINVLTVGDYNTCGLFGDDADKSGHYYNFLKSVGSSSKTGETGGSFGLGKGSFFAGSSLNTIFVSSKYNRNKFVFQGKLRLVSHKIGDDVKQGNGSFGHEHQRPVRDINLIPQLFRRDEQGTDIHIVGFHDEKHWRDNMLRSILNNFWYAILKDKLEVEISNIKVNKDNLDELMAENFSDKNFSRNEDNPIPYYEAFRNPTKVFSKELPTLGEVQLYVKQRDDFPSRVACFRKTGMLIETRRHNQMYRYAAVFICENDKGNEVLRKMEPPAHDKWTKDSPNAKQGGRTLPDVARADNQMRKFIRDSLKSLNIVGESDSLSIRGLTKYLYLPGEEGKDDSSEGVPGAEYEDKVGSEETGVERGATSKNEILLKETKTVQVIKKPISGETKDDGNATVEGKGNAVVLGSGSNEGDEGKGKESEKAKEKSGQELVRILENFNFRSFGYMGEGKIKHKLVLRGDPNKKCKIALKAGTDDYFDSINILSAKVEGGNELKFDNDYIHGITFDNKGESDVIVEFDTEERYSLRVVGYEDK